MLKKNFCFLIETVDILHVGHRCAQTIIIGRTWDDVRAKVRKQRKVWSARRARWQTWKKFGVDWEFVKQQSRIADIRHARRLNSKRKCKIIDADKRVIKKLKVKKLSITKQPGICVTPSLYTSDVEANMLSVTFPINILPLTMDSNKFLFAEQH